MLKPLPNRQRLVNSLVAGSVADNRQRSVYIAGMVTRIGHKRRLHLYITEWMAERGLSDDTLAGRMDTDRTTVWRWRTQQHRLNPDKIAAIAHALDLEPAELFRPPGSRSIDALISGAPDELQATAFDVVKRLVGRN